MGPRRRSGRGADLGSEGRGGGVEYDVETSPGSSRDCDRQGEIGTSGSLVIMYRVTGAIHTYSEGQLLPIIRNNPRNC